MKDAGAPAGDDMDGGAEPSKGVRFVEVTKEAGLTYAQAPDDSSIGCDAGPICDFTGIHLTGGAAAGDFDGDGFIDLLVTRLEEPAILFRNRGDGTFEDVTEQQKLVTGPGSNGAAWGDIDNDGDVDLYVTNMLDLRFHLFINDGNLGFREQGIARGAAIETEARHRGFSVSFGDYNRDGYLDIHTTEWTRTAPSSSDPYHARLLKNRGESAPGFFSDVTEKAGVDLLTARRPSRFAFASNFTDLDNDGWPDLTIVADFQTSHLYWNNGDGTFTDGTLFSQVGTDQNGMGSALGDYDNDGDIDWFITAIFDPFDSCGGGEFCRWGTTGNRLYRNEGGRMFSDYTDFAGVRDGYWGWGTSFFDYDNDSDLDLVMTNGVDYPNPEAMRFSEDPMRLWRNDGTGKFDEVSKALGLDNVQDGKGLVVFDYDNDGDQDLFVANHEQPPALYRNDGGNDNAWLRVQLEGRKSNSLGIGAHVVVRFVGGRELLREVRAGSQFLGQNETIAHFGLGPGVPEIEHVWVRWPGGREQTVPTPQINRLLVISE